MAMVKQLDKRSGITYIYESASYWDREKKQPRSKRTLIGRLNPTTGEIVPTDGRGKRRAQKEDDPAVRKGPVPVARTNRLFFGATYLLDQIGEVTGLTADLKTCFPNTYKQILSIAYYLVLEDQNPLFRFKKWAAIHRHPFGKDIPSQRSTELFQSVTEEAKMHFFRLQGKRRAEKEYWAYDSTSISSRSETLRQVKYGKNKDDDQLPQINLALVFGEESAFVCKRVFIESAGDYTEDEVSERVFKALGLKDCNIVSTDQFVNGNAFFCTEQLALHRKFPVESLQTVKQSGIRIFGVVTGLTFLLASELNDQLLCVSIAFH